MCQHLFDDKEQSIVSCITALFQKFPLDIRAPMLENMIVIGGGAMLPGTFEPFTTYGTLTSYG